MDDVVMMLGGCIERGIYRIDCYGNDRCCGGHSTCKCNLERELHNRVSYRLLRLHHHCLHLLGLREPHCCAIEHV